MHFVKEKLWYTQVDFYKFHRRTSRGIVSPNSESITAWQNCHEYSYSKYIPRLYHFPIIIIIHYEQHNESWPSVASDRLNRFLAVGSALLPEWSFQKQNDVFLFRFPRCTLLHELSSQEVWSSSIHSHKFIAARVNALHGWVKKCLSHQSIIAGRGQHTPYFWRNWVI